MNTTHTDQPTHPGTPEAATMRAIVQACYGSDPDAVLAVAQTSRPSIGDDEVLVRVAAAGIDMGTWHCMTGMPYAMRLAGFGLRAPKALNPGRGFAGTVEATGRSVTSLQPGDEVYGSGDGSFAEHVAAPADQVARKPWNLTFVQAAAVPISGSTALQGLGKGGVHAGQRVLIVGASGGVGSFAVQIAKAMGRLADVRRALTRTGTLVIVGGETDGRWVGGFGRSLRAVALSAIVRQRLTPLVSTEQATELDVLRGMIESGQVTPAVDRTFPMAEAAAALRHIGGGRARGKVVITT